MCFCFVPLAFVPLAFVPLASFSLGFPLASSSPCMPAAFPLTLSLSPPLLHVADRGVHARTRTPAPLAVSSRPFSSLTFLSLHGPSSLVSHSRHPLCNNSPFDHPSCCPHPTLTKHSHHHGKRLLEQAEKVYFDDAQGPSKQRCPTRPLHQMLAHNSSMNDTNASAMLRAAAEKYKIVGSPLSLSLIAFPARDINIGET